MEFAKSQIDYILGSTGRSFLIGFGEEYPQRPHHSARWVRWAKTLKGFLDTVFISRIIYNLK